MGNESMHATLRDAMIYFAEFEHCKDFMVDLRWPDGKITCPRCGGTRLCWVEKQRLWKCYEGHRQPTFTLKTGTIFEDSPLPLEKWLPAVWMLFNCKNGISSYELHRDLGVTQKTAWFMLSRIRLAMQDDLSGGKLGGPMGPVVEVDETYIGGKARNMHKDRKSRALGGSRGGVAGKAVVLGILERNGKVRTRVSKTTAQSEIRHHVLNNVEFGSRVHSDEAAERWAIPQHYIHEMVNHAAQEYVRGNVHTNGIENFWALLKRSIGGTYVSVEPFHLFRYVDEQAFRFNNRKTDDVHRFVIGMQQILGRRLTYKQLTGKEQVVQHG